MGCLTAPFKLIGCLVVVAALGLAWLYRDRLEHEARRVIDRVREAAPSGVASSPEGRPGVNALESANAKVDSLNGWRADSVVLTPSEFASLVGSGMDRQLRSQLDSLKVELLDGEIRVSARLRTAGLSFVRDPMGTPQIPNWNRVTSALPDFLQALREAVEADNR